MMKPLRARHFQVWLAWSLLIPAGIVLGWLVIPYSSPVTLLQPEAAGLLPWVRYQADRPGYTVLVRSNRDTSQWQVEWKNKLPLAVPSAVIYSLPGDTGAPINISSGELIGRIEARGDYLFTLRPDSLGRPPGRLVLYDFIHENILDSFQVPLHQQSNNRRSL